MPMTKVKQITHTIMQRLTTIQGAVDLGVIMIAEDACNDLRNQADVLCHEIRSLRKDGDHHEKHPRKT